MSRLIRALALGITLTIMLVAPVAAQQRVSSPAFDLSGAVAMPRRYTAADLRKMPAQTQAVEFQSGAQTRQTSYTGTSLYGLIQSAGPLFNPAVNNDALKYAVRVTGSDGYVAIVAWGEIDPGFEGKPIMVAYDEQGAPLGEGDGAARLVVPGDRRGGRYVSAITAIALVNTAGPTPAAPALPSLGDLFGAMPR